MKKKPTLADEVNELELAEIFFEAYLISPEKGKEVLDHLVSKAISETDKIGITKVHDNCVKILNDGGVKTEGMKH